MESIAQPLAELQLAEPDRATFVELNRTRLRLWCWGNADDPPVLLLHGAYDHGRMFDDLAPRVAALGYHAIAIDFRGHGDSGPLDSGFVWTLLHIDLALLVRSLGRDPVGVIAHSFGGGQAIGLAGAFPELVRWLVNIDGLGPPVAAMAVPDDIPAAVANNDRRIDRVLFENRRTAASVEELGERRSATNLRLSDAWALHLARHGTRYVEDDGWVWKADPMFGLGVPSDFSVELLAEEQRRVQCPVLVLTGDQPDTWRDLSEADEAERIGWLRARHVVVPGTGHYVHLEDPDATMAAITAFISEVTR